MQRWGWSSASSLLGSAPNPKVRLPSPSSVLVERCCSVSPRGMWGGPESTHTPLSESQAGVSWGGRSMAVTSSLRSHHSHFVKPELQPHLQHGGRMKTALDRRGSLPNSLQLGREAPQQHSSPLTPKFDLPWSLEELREGQDAAQLSWGMDAVPLRMKPRCLGQRCCPQKQKLVRVPAPRAPGKVAASSE